MADDLRLKVSQADYQQKMQVLQSKMAELETIYGEYSRLKMQANRVLGDGDTNLQQLMDAVQKMLKESWDMLNKQNEELGITTTQVGDLFKSAADLIGAAANTFKTLSDL